VEGGEAVEAVVDELRGGSLAVHKSGRQRHCLGGEETLV